MLWCLLVFLQRSISDTTLPSLRFSTHVFPLLIANKERRNISRPNFPGTRSVESLGARSDELLLGARSVEPLSGARSVKSLEGSVGRSSVSRFSRGLGRSSLSRELGRSSLLGTVDFLSGVRSVESFSGLGRSTVSLGSVGHAWQRKIFLRNPRTLVTLSVSILA